MFVLLDSVLNQLMKPTRTEKAQLSSLEFQGDLPSDAVNETQHINNEEIVLNNFFFKNKNIYISKHNRYAPYPKHSHTFLEVNYMLRGSCDQVVDGDSVHLSTGDLLLLDVGCTHSIGYLGTNDLLINILFQGNEISIGFLNDLKSSNNVLYEFLLNRIIGSQNEAKHLIFKHEKGSEIQKTLDRIIEEYYLQKDFSDAIISAYLSILITQLVRNYNLGIDGDLSPKQKLVAQILNDIHSNYVTSSLEKNAQRYGYNKNYLSNLFKSVTGETFSDVLTKQRIINANTLLDSTDLPISAVMKKVGISNRTFFYKKYEEAYKHLPRKKTITIDSK